MARLASLSVHTPAVVAMPTFDRLLEAATITVAEAAMLVVLAEEDEGNGIKVWGTTRCEAQQEDDVEADEVAARKHVPKDG